VLDLVSQKSPVGQLPSAPHCVPPDGTHVDRESQTKPDGQSAAVRHIPVSWQVEPLQ